MPVPPIRAVRERSLLRNDVYNSLLEAIIDGTLAPGERLRDLELAEWLGVSRTPVREALLRLDKAGLVITDPGRSTTVAPYDAAATLHSQQVVAAMHELAARHGVAALTSEDIATLTEANARFSAALERKDIQSALTADDDFHGVFVAASGNAVIAEVLEQITPVLRRAEWIRFGVFSAQDSVREHAEIIRLAETGNIEHTAHACRDNWLSSSYSSPEASETERD